MHNVPRTVLIVDDAQEDRLLIGRALRQDAGVDYHLLEAENGTQALAYLRFSRTFGAGTMNIRNMSCGGIIMDCESV